MSEKLESALEAVARASGADHATVLRLRRAVRGDDRKKPEAYLNTKQVAARLNWHPKTVLRHAKQLNAIHRSKRCVRFPVSAVERFEANEGEGTCGGDPDKVSRRRAAGNARREKMASQVL